MTLVDDAMELLNERTGRTVVVLHAEHDDAAYAYVEADIAHSGAVTLSARALANLLTRPDPTPDDPAEATSEPSALYQAAERRRRSRPSPPGPLDPAAFRRCLGEARAAMARCDR